MKNYLVIIRADVADEGDVGLIKVLNEEEYNKADVVYTGFGNIEGETYSLQDVSSVYEISKDELKVLRKFGLTNLRFGYCDIDEYDSDETDFDDDWDDEE